MLDAAVRRVRRTARWEIREWLDVLAAQVELGRAWWLVRRRRRGRLVSHYVSDGPLPLNRRVAPDVVSLARAIHRASSYGLFRPQCLVRALALHRMLNARGIEGAVIRLGVKRDGEGLLAHAWIEWEGMIVGDDPRHIDAFRRLGELTRAERPA